MRKLIFIFSIILILSSITFYLYKKVKENEFIEEVYTIKTSHSYLSDGNLNFDIKLYTNKTETLLAYPKEANIYMHDYKKENIIECNVNNSRLNNTTTFNGMNLYEYVYGLNIKISEIYIKECYLTIEFDNKEYELMVGSFEVINSSKNYDDIVQITELYGLTNEQYNMSLNGIIITIKNTTNETIFIDEISIGRNYKISQKNENIVDAKESNDIYDYCPNYHNKMKQDQEKIELLSNEKHTFILPIIYLYDYYLYNSFLCFKIGENFYYFPNFTYIDSSDLQAINKYVVKGYINES